MSIGRDITLRSSAVLVNGSLQIPLECVVLLFWRLGFLVALTFPLSVRLGGSGAGDAIVKAAGILISRPTKIVPLVIFIRLQCAQ